MSEWNDPDPVACVKAYVSGAHVLLKDYGYLCKDTLFGRALDRRYRIVPPKPKTYTALQAAEAYFGRRWIWSPGHGDPGNERDVNAFNWRHVTYAPCKDAIAAFSAQPTGWLISDTDPREKPYQCCVCEQRFEWNAMQGCIDGELICRACANRPKPKPVPRQVDVHEALRVYVAGGKVRAPLDGLDRSSDRRTQAFHCMPGEIDEPWTILEEPHGAT